jgi:very-short-patch-repair endonuclease
VNRIRTRARELRNNPTDAERVFWRQLRFWQLDGYKFRRQQPLGRYIVDFVCLEKRVVVEVDGGQHNDKVDAERDSWLRDEGFVVLKILESRCAKNHRCCQRSNIEEFTKHPLPQSFPARGKEAESESEA